MKGVSGRESETLLHGAFFCFRFHDSVFNRSNNNMWYDVSDTYTQVVFSLQCRTVECAPGKVYHVVAPFGVSRSDGRLDVAVKRGNMISKKI